MSPSDVHRPLPEAPARAVRREVASPWPGTRLDHFEVVSRGDFVPGSLLRPTDSGPTPLLLLVRDRDEPTRADALAPVVEWVRQGLAVATIDLPLFGERASPKLSARLVLGLEQLARDAEAATDGGLDAETGALVEEFARQSTSDLIRALDALAILPDIDPERLAFMGVGVGATTGSYLLAHDARPCAAVLVDVCGGRGVAALDPARHLAGSKADRLLFVTPDAADPARAKAAQACFDAAPEPKRALSASAAGEGAHVGGTLDDADLASVRAFLFDALGL